MGHYALDYYIAGCILCFLLNCVLVNGPICAISIRAQRDNCIGTLHFGLLHSRVFPILLLSCVLLHRPIYAISIQASRDTCMGSLHLGLLHSQVFPILLLCCVLLHGPICASSIWAVSYGALVALLLCPFSVRCIFFIFFCFLTPPLSLSLSPLIPQPLSTLTPNSLHSLSILSHSALTHSISHPFAPPYFLTSLLLFRRLSRFDTVSPKRNEYAP